MDRARFEALVGEALDEIPEPLRSHLEQVVSVDDKPGVELLGEKSATASGSTPRPSKPKDIR